MWPPWPVQELNSSAQRQMQQHRKSTHGKHTTKFKSQNATTLQWSSKACQPREEIGPTHWTFCNPIPWHHSIPSQPTWRNNLWHNLARHPNEFSQNMRYQKLRPVCQRENCNTQTIQIQPTTPCQLWQWNLWSLWTQTAFQHVCKAGHPQHWLVSQPNTQRHHRFCQVQCLPSWCLTGSIVRTNKKKLFSIQFQSTSLRNNCFATHHSLFAVQHNCTNTTATISVAVTVWTN